MTTEPTETLRSMAAVRRELRRLLEPSVYERSGAVTTDEQSLAALKVFTFGGQASKSLIEVGLKAEARRLIERIRTERFETMRLAARPTQKRDASRRWARTAKLSGQRTPSIHGRAVRKSDPAAIIAMPPCTTDDSAGITGERASLENSRATNYWDEPLKWNRAAGGLALFSVRGWPTFLITKSTSSTANGYGA
jgi:hypothetical protein